MLEHAPTPLALESAWTFALATPLLRNLAVGYFKGGSHASTSLKTPADVESCRQRWQGSSREKSPRNASTRRSRSRDRHPNKDLSLPSILFHSRDGYGIRDIAYLSRLSQAVLRRPCWRENAPFQNFEPSRGRDPVVRRCFAPKRRGPGRPPNPVTEHPESLWDRRDMVSPLITDAHPTIGVGSGGRRITLALLCRRPIAGHRVAPAEELSLHSMKPSSKRRAPPQSSKSSAWPWCESI